MRDFQYVTDTVSAFQAVAALGEHGNVYNAGSGHATGLGMVTEWARNESGKSVASGPNRKRPLLSEVKLLRANAGKLGALWAPKVSLMDGLALTLKWWRGQPLRADTGYMV